MWKPHQNISINLLLLIFLMKFPPKCTKSPLVLNISLYQTLPVILPFITNTYILIHLKVKVSILPQPFLQHTHYLSIKNINKTQTNIIIIICATFLNNRTPINNQQFTFNFFWEVRNTVFSPFYNIFFI